MRSATSHSEESTHRLRAAVEVAPPLAAAVLAVRAVVLAAVLVLVLAVVIDRLVAPPARVV